jgi:hypothetical protein
MGLGHWFAPPGLGDHVGEREARQVLSHVISHVSPDTEQDALALVVARTVLVGFAEVPRRDRTIDGRDDLGEGDGLGGAGEHVAAADATLGSNEPDALQAEQDLFKVGLGQTGALSQVTH